MAGRVVCTLVALALVAGAVQADGLRPARVDTKVDTPENPRVAVFFEELKQIILKEVRTIPWQGTTYYENKEWLRDHIHILKATRYWKLTDRPPVLDPRTPLELWIRNQFPDGLYPEIVVGAADPHVGYTRPEYTRPIEGGRMLIRLEAENDIEYLMAQAVWQAWKATGDAAWLVTPLEGSLSPLASLEKALQHVLGDDGRRWDAKLGLAVRGVSCDTWDWVYGQKGKDANRRIESETPLAVFHGDNTGLYQAFVQVAEMLRCVAKDEARARLWETRADELKSALMKLAWNGRYFAHMVHTRPTVETAPTAWRTDFAGDWTRLSLSNAYALNRGFFDRKAADGVLGAFLDLRTNPPRGANGEIALAHEWVTVYPGYQNVEAILYPPGRYANGALASFTAGELMRGAYVYGYDGYGADILKRLMKLAARDGEIVFMYEPNGEVFEKKAPGYDKKALSLGGGGPAGWGTAAVYEAMVAGLAGVRDVDASFTRLTFAPGWDAFGVGQASASVSFATVDDCFAYDYRHDRTAHRMDFLLSGSRKAVVAARIPVPPGMKPVRVLVDDGPVAFRVRQGPSGDLDAATGRRAARPRSVADFALARKGASTRIAVLYE